MPPTTLSHQLLSTIYPLKEADRQRDPNTQLSVLALGLSRSGTDSLRQALIQLGYSECYHGFVCGSRYPDLKAWCRLYAYKAELARQRGLVPPTDPNDMSWWHFDSGLTREDFEPMLADCRAVTDLPCCMFIYELIRCYPEAKVLVNFREDVDAWHKSIETNCKIPFTQNREWKYMSLCSAEFFWWYRAWRLSFGTYWDISNWDARGKAFHNEHYAHLRRVAKEYGRETLEWRVQDGWYVRQG